MAVPSVQYVHLGRQTVTQIRSQLAKSVVLANTYLPLLQLAWTVTLEVPTWTLIQPRNVMHAIQDSIPQLGRQIVFIALLVITTTTMIHQRHATLTCHDVPRDTIHQLVLQNVLRAHLALQMRMATRQPSALYVIRVTFPRKTLRTVNNARPDKLTLTKMLRRCVQLVQSGFPRLLEVYYVQLVLLAAQT